MQVSYLTLVQYYENSYIKDTAQAEGRTRFSIHSWRNKEMHQENNQPFVAEHRILTSENIP